MASIALAQHHRTFGSAGTAPRQRGPDPAGAPLAFERARPSQRAAHGSAPERGSVHDWVARRVETARISLKRTPRFRLAPRGGQNGARPGLGRFCTGSALSALWKAGSGFPIDPGTSEAAPLLRSPTQVLRRRSARPTPTLPEDGRCLPPLPPNPMARGRSVRAPTALNESGWA